jgi:hypothetical protein
MQVTALLEHIAQEGDSWLAAVFNALALLLAQNGLFGNPFPSHYLLRNTWSLFLKKKERDWISLN